jgi:glycosyltransferase involved in cell wall biosynthesis
VEVIHHVTWGSLSGGSVLPGGRPVLVFGPVSGGQRAPAALRPLLGAGRGQELLRDVFAGIAPRRPGRARRTLAAADLVLATNSDTARLAAARGARRVEMMLADGLPEDYLRAEAPVRDLRRPVVLWVGSLRAIKVPTLAVAAFRHVLDARPGARLRLIGDGPLRGDVERECDRLGLGDAVQRVGRVPWPALPGEYDDAAVLLFTSARDAFGTQSLEGWGRALPSVGFAQHGLADFAPPDGTILVPPAAPARAARNLADAVLAVLADPERHRRMSTAALDAARSHTWSRKVARAGALYDELLGVPAARGIVP